MGINAKKKMRRKKNKKMSVRIMFETQIYKQQEETHI